jgi:hypothetical protein
MEMFSSSHLSEEVLLERREKQRWKKVRREPGTVCSNCLSTSDVSRLQGLLARKLLSRCE